MRLHVVGFRHLVFAPVAVKADALGAEVVAVGRSLVVGGLDFEAIVPEVGDEVPGLDYLLRQLAKYGDRVSIVLDRKLRDSVRIDSSVFHLVLADS